MQCTQVVNISVAADWVSAVANVLLLVLTAVSVCYAYKAYVHQKERSRKEAACNLAQYYASNIIDKYADITGVFDSAGIAEIIRGTFELRDLQEFDKAELEQFLSKAGTNINDFKKKFSDIDPAIILSARLSRPCSAEERGSTFNSYTTKDENGKIQVINGVFLQADFNHEISSLLNELEWFAMSCKYGLADEELLYQSLHQTFLSTVWMLYFFISSANENNEDKLYTNISWLFIEWRDRLVDITDNKEAEKQEYIDKANSVKAKVYEGTKLK